MLHPVLVIAIRVVLARMRTAALQAICRRFDRGGRIEQQVLKFERLDEVGIPDQRAVGYADIVEAANVLRSKLDALVQHLAGAEHRGVALHDLLHFETNFGGRSTAVWHFAA